MYRYTSLMDTYRVWSGLHECRVYLQCAFRRYVEAYAGPSETFHCPGVGLKPDYRSVPSSRVRIVQRSVYFFSTFADPRPRTKPAKWRSLARSPVLAERVFPGPPATWICRYISAHNRRSCARSGGTRSGKILSGRGRSMIIRIETTAY